MMRAFFAFCLLVFSLGGYSQTSVTLNGFVRDSSTQETIIGATININGKSVLSNAYGFFSISIPPGDYTLTISHVSHRTISIPLSISQNTEKNILLPGRSGELAEVVVYSKKRDGNVRNAQMGKIDLSIAQVRNIPAFLGEVDILKAVQLLPGVQSAGEGNSGFYVRGGGPDQNLIILDDAVVYNTGHLFGFFSIFNPDAIKNTSLIKGGMPAQYGGRLSSVLDVTMKDGNLNEFTGEGGIGLIASRLSLQGPLVKNKASFMVSARRTYVDVIAKPFISKDANAYGSGYYFYDLNAKLNYRFSDKDRLFLSAYFGRDVFTYRDRENGFRADIPWGNSTATLRWNHVFNPKLFSNTTLVYNDYNFSFGAAQESFQVTLKSGIRDFSIKSDFDYYPTGNHRLKFGISSIHHRFTPNVASGQQDTVVFRPNNIRLKYGLESAIYVQDDWDVSRDLQLALGLRYSRFTQLGPYTRYFKDQNQNNIDSITYSSFKGIQTYAGFEPRISVRYALNDVSSFKGSVTRSQQYVHLVSNSATTLPTDLWVPSTFRVKPQLSWQYAAGYFRNFKNNEIETSLEVYYKSLSNQIEYEEGYTDNQLRDNEEAFVFGKGWSYGAELFLNKTRGRFTGWLGYTLSWTWRKFDQINGGVKYPAKYDRRHDLSLVGNYEHSARWKFGAVFIYGTGNSTSLPERFYTINGALTQEFSSVNKYRLAPYHRLDISATLTPKNKGKKIQGYWVFAIYNIYSRKNPYFLYFDQTGNVLAGGATIQAKQVSLFPILPSVTWNFKF